ncbi:MAG: hypothetical protein HOG34_21965, partial [Bacteroidetes bacterium]|nr:hypothetical protein [Bacteroidota bacterium]
MHKLNVSVLVAIFYLLITDSSFGQRLRDLKLIFSEQEVSVYECAASAGRYASFRTTNFDADMHYIYDFKTGKTRAIYESGEGFMEEVEESTSNLVWSPTKETYFIFKMVKDGVGTPVFGEINQNIDISLTRMNVKGENQTQANTSTILAWGGRDEVLFSRCKRCQNNTIDVPASDYDLFSFPMRNYLRGKTVTDQYKPLPKSPEIREMNASYINRFESIVSGIFMEHSIIRCELHFLYIFD